MIDWSSLAEPQDDGYDSEIIGDLATESFGFEKGIITGSSFLGGEVELRAIETSSIFQTIPSFDDKEFLQAENLLISTWNTIYAQCQYLLVAVYPFIHEKSSEDDGERLGYWCSHGDFGEVIVRVYEDSSINILEGLVHELANWKLHAMGVHMTYWDSLITNGVDELYEISTLPNDSRSIGHLLHVLYSHTHTFDLLQRIERYSSSYLYNRRRTGFLPDYETLYQPSYKLWIKEFRNRIIADKLTLNRNLRTTADGTAFYGGLSNWIDRLLML